MSGLVGRPLAEAVHPVCRDVDPGQGGLRAAEIEAALAAAGVEIGGVTPRQVLGSALNNAQDLFEVAQSSRWRWIEPVERRSAVMSGIALAEEAYRLAMRHDPERLGIHYEMMKSLLLEDGVNIRGGNQGKTVFGSLQNAPQWFEWVASGTFRWKL